MAKKKQKFDARLLAYLLLAFLIGASIGLLMMAAWPRDTSPDAIVFVADDTVSAPADLLSYLETEMKGDCKDYQGTNTATGVPLASVYEVVEGKYARIAIGCSTNLDDGFPVIKTDDGWKLYSGASYYRAISDETNAMWEDLEVYPRCSIVDKHQISNEFAPVCIEDTKAKENALEYSRDDLRTNTYE